MVSSVDAVAIVGEVCFMSRKKSIRMRDTFGVVVSSNKFVPMV